LVGLGRARCVLERRTFARAPNRARSIAPWEDSIDSAMDGGVRQPRALDLVTDAAAAYATAGSEA
jgi:hypothetical protein